ncbi:MAG: hypothetical protein NZM29_08215 [Nitrospira sp.]|nr:hypothetical protein [Nitrospira sp.]
MNPAQDADLLARAVIRARQRPEFMAQVLAIYQDMKAMTETQLRCYLGVKENDWPRLQLCLRPRADVFLKDVTQIAHHFGIDRSALAAILRHVDAVSVLQERNRAGSTGTLLAARTRKSRRRSTKERPGDE